MTKQIIKSSLFDKGNTKAPMLFGTGQRPDLKSWQEETDRITPKGWGPNQARDGCPVENQAEMPDAGGPKLDTVSLPPEFCVYCGRTDICEDQACHGMFIFKESYPGLGIKKGDGASHYACVPCTQNMLFPEHKSALVLPKHTKKMHKQAMHLEAESNIIAYIKAQRASGVTGSIYGSESRRERFKEYDAERH